MPPEAIAITVEDKRDVIRPEFSARHYRNASSVFFHLARPIHLPAGDERSFRSGSE